MESVLGYLRADHSDVILDAMCKGPDGLRERYGVAAIPLNWYQKYEKQASGVTAIALKTLGKGVDVFRTASWVRRHDVVIVPGTGILEASLPLRPWGMPYAMFLLCASGRLFGTKVALVSVGATVINQRLTRWLLSSAARLAFYRSYRDIGSRDAMRQQGVDTTRDHVYLDLAFGIPAPPYDPGDPQTVGVGVMDYHGANDDRGQADELYASYVEKMKSFVLWLVDSGRRVRLLVGDTNNSDEGVVQEILADLRAHRPDLDPAVGHRGTGVFVRGTDTGDGTGKHRRRDAFSQRDMRAHALQAHHIARLLGEVHCPDGGDGTVGVLPVRRLAGRRTAD